MIELIYPFLGSVIITILLRRLDKSNLNLKKLKTIIEKGQKEILELTIEKKEELRDATSKFDLLLTDSSKYLTTIQNEIKNAKNSLSEINESRKNLNSMGEELISLEENTKSVKSQLQYVNSSLDKIDYHQKKIKKLQDHIKDVDSDAAKMIRLFQDTLDEKTKEITFGLEKKFTQIIEDTNDFQNKLKTDIAIKNEETYEDLRKKYSEVETSFKEGAEEFSNIISEQIEDQSAKIHVVRENVKNNEQEILNQTRELVEINNQVNTIKTNFSEKIDYFYKNLEEKKDILMQDFIDESEKIRESIKNLDFDTLAKKDELIRTAREEASNIKNYTNELNSVYREAIEDLDKKLLEKESDLIQTIETFEQKEEHILHHLKIEKDKQLKVLQNNIDNAIKTIENKSEFAFNESFKKFQNENDDLLEQFNETKDSIKEFEISTEEKLGHFENQTNEIYDKIKREHTHYISHLKHNANELINDFEEEISKKQNNISEYLNNIEGDLHNLREQSIDDIDNKIARIFEKMGTIDKNMLDTQSHFKEQWKSDSSRLIKTIQEKEDELEQKTERWQVDLENILNETKSDIHKGNLELEKRKSELINDFENEIDEQIEKISEISEDFSGSNEKKLSEMVLEFKNKVTTKEDHFIERIRNVSEEFQEMKDKLEHTQVETLEQLDKERRNIEHYLKEANKEQLDNFNNLAEENKVSNLSDYQDHLNILFSEMREKSNVVMKDFISIKEKSEETFAEFQERQNEVMEAVISETKLTGKEIQELQSDLAQLKKQSEILEKSEKNINNIKSVVLELDEKLSMAEEKNQSIKEIYEQTESLKSMRIKLDAELTALAHKREKIDKLDDQIHLILNIKDEIEEKNKDLISVKNNIASILNQYSDVDLQKEKLDNVLKEFVNQQKVVQSAIDSIAHQDKHLHNVQENVEGLSIILEKMDQKTIVLKDEVGKLDNQMLTLHKKDSEIQEIKRKFLEIEDLIEDIDRRKEILIDLKKKFELLKSDMNNSVHKIEKIEQNAENKVKLLTDFVSAANENIPKKTFQEKSDLLVSDSKNMIIKLTNMGWKVDDIVSHLKIARGTVETVLSSYVH